MRSSWGLFSVALALVGVVILIVSGRLDMSGSGPTRGAAFDACVRFAGERLKASATTKFSSLDETDERQSKVWLIAQHPPRFEVTAHVDSPDSSGAMVRNYLTCDLTFAEDKPEWSLVSLGFSERPPADRANEGRTDP